MSVLNVLLGTWAVVMTVIALCSLWLTRLYRGHLAEALAGWKRSVEANGRTLEHSQRVLDSAMAAIAEAEMLEALQQGQKLKAQA